MKKRGLRDPDPARMFDLKQKDKKNRSYLGKRIGLAKDAGAEITQAGNGIEHGAGAQNGDVATEHQHRVLPGNLVQDGKHHEHGAEQELVGNGIEILAEHGLLLQGPSKQSIETVAEPSQHKQDQRAFVMAGDQIDHDERHEPHAQQGQLVGRSEQLGKLHFCSPDRSR